MIQVKLLRNLSFLPAADSDSQPSDILLHVAYRPSRIIYPSHRRDSVNPNYLSRPSLKPLTINP